MLKKNIDIKMNKRILSIIGVSILFVVLIITLIVTGSLSKLMGNSTTEYYCEDTSYNLEESKCVKQLREKSILLGDLDGDDKVTEADLKVMEEYINRFYEEEDPQFTDEQILAADISKDDEIFDNDLTLFKQYFGGNGSMGNVYSDTIGVERNCKWGYTLNGVWCTKKEVVAAKIKNKILQYYKNDEENTTTTQTDEDISLDITDNLSELTGNKSVYQRDRIGDKNITKITLNAQFRVNSSKKYYYKFFTYRYDTLNFESDCLMVKNEITHPTLDLTLGRRKGKFVIYSDDSCKNIVKEYETEKYKNHFLDGELIVANSVKVVKTETIDVFDGSIETDNNPSQSKNYYPHNTNLTVAFKINVYDKSKKYYYKFVGQDASLNANSSECFEISDSKTVYYKFNIGNNYEDRVNILECENGICYKKRINKSIWNRSIRFYDDRNECQLGLVSSKYSKYQGLSTPDYKLQTFDVVYKKNDGTTDYTNTYVYNLKNKTSKLGNPSNRHKYLDFMGYKVKNSKGKYICYKDENKSKQGYTDESTCKKYGYVYYSGNDILARTTSVHDEKLEFIGQWTDEPVTISIADYPLQYMAVGTQISIPILFKVNSHLQDYYFRWGYTKTNYGNERYSDREFLDKVDQYSRNAIARSGGNWNMDQQSCYKVKDNEYFIPTLTVEKKYNVGIVLIYTDSNCISTIDSITNTHKTTKVYRCSDC